MKTFTLGLTSPTRSERIPDCVSFTAKDASGSFGILPNAFRRVTVLSFGIASLRRADQSTEYLALPGGVLYFARNELKIATTGFVRSRDIQEISAALDERIRLEEKSVHDIKRSLHRLDQEILKRLSVLGRFGNRAGVP